jgi:hypothetical protein
MSGGCTIGAKRHGMRYFLFKNKDLPYVDFKDSAVFDDEIFAIAGIDTNAEEREGVSIGVNRWGLAACSATVLATEDSNYDVLVERILRESHDLASAHAIVQEDIEDEVEYQSCNIVLVSASELGVLEVGPGICELERDPVMLCRTNHHLLLPTTEEVKRAPLELRGVAGPLSASHKRRLTAQNLLASANVTQDFITLLSTHSELRGYDSICRHRDAPVEGAEFLGQTVYSYVLEMMVLNSTVDIALHIARGVPCSSSYRTFALRFDDPLDKKQALLAKLP